MACPNNLGEELAKTPVWKGKSQTKYRSVLTKDWVVALADNFMRMRGLKIYPTPPGLFPEPVAYSFVVMIRIDS